MSEGTELHRRTIDFDVARGADGRTSVTGELVDLRRIGMGRHLGADRGPGVVHHMGISVAIDEIDVVESVEAWMKAAPFAATSLTRGEGCSQILPNYRQLVGKRLDQGYAARILEEVGGPRGCFHVSSLAQCLPFAVRAAGAGKTRREIEIRASSLDRPGFRLVARLVDRVAGGLRKQARLALELEVPTFRIARAEADGPQAARASGLEGLTISRGFTALAMERLGDARDLFALVVAMSPVTSQAAGAYGGFLGLGLHARSKAAGRRGNPQVDSCHMWRSDGPLVALASSDERKGEAR